MNSLFFQCANVLSSRRDPSPWQTSDLDHTLEKLTAYFPVKTRKVICKRVFGCEVECEVMLQSNPIQKAHRIYDLTFSLHCLNTQVFNCSLRLKAVD